LGGIAAAQDWYISNAAGMALEPAFSRLALRNKYALSVDRRLPGDIPGELAAYYDGAYTVELRTLYEEGEVSKRQWIFRDEAGRDRLAAAFSETGSGFIEEYDEQGLLREEHLIDAAGGDQIAAYSYRDGLLVKAEVRLKSPPPAEAEAPAGTAPAAGPDASEPGPAGPDASGPASSGPDASGAGPASGPDVSGAGPASGPDASEPGPAGPDAAGPASGPDVSEAGPDTPAAGAGEEILTDLWTDYYRYSRSRGLRAVDRVFHQAVPAEGLPPVRLRFPHLILEAALAEEEFVGPAAAYASDFLQDIFTARTGRVLYTLDERGRILRETRYDEDGNILGELRNTWAGDRLASVGWVSGEDERLSEYDYDGEGNRIAERSYNKGALERVVRREGEEEVEELYMNGVVILRAVWGKDGRKISEERVRNGPGIGEP
jgi:hypothetical protein